MPTGTRSTASRKTPTNQATATGNQKDSDKTSFAAAVRTTNQAPTDPITLLILKRLESMIKTQTAESANHFEISQNKSNELANTIQDIRNDLNNMENRLKIAENHFPAKNKTNPVNTNRYSILNDEDDSDTNNEDEATNPFETVPPRKQKSSKPSILSPISEDKTDNKIDSSEKQDENTHGAWN